MVFSDGSSARAEVVGWSPLLSAERSKRERLRERAARERVERAQHARLNRANMSSVPCLYDACCPVYMPEVERPR